MNRGSGRLRWSVALAAFVGGVGGSFLAGVLYSIGATPFDLASIGARPVLAGEAALFVDFALGTPAGVSVGALVAFVVGRGGWERTGAVIGSVFGLIAAASVALAAPWIAVAWIDGFSSDPLEAAVVGGAIAGVFAGGIAAALQRTPRVVDPGARRPTALAAIVGSIAGLLAGVLGGGLGAMFAQSTSVCPNGYYVNPNTGAACPPGLVPGALIYGAWAGAVAGALAALAVDAVLAWLRASART